MICYVVGRFNYDYDSFKLVSQVLIGVFSYLAICAIIGVNVLFDTYYLIGSRAKVKSITDEPYRFEAEKNWVIVYYNNNSETTNLDAEISIDKITMPYRDFKLNKYDSNNDLFADSVEITFWYQSNLNTDYDGQYYPGLYETYEVDVSFAFVMMLPPLWN